MMKDNKEKISDENRGKLESSLNEVKEALKGQDAMAIKTAGEKLNETWQTVSAELYKGASERANPKQGPAGGQSGTHTEPDASQPSENGEGPIIDAEVVGEKTAS